MTDRESLEHEGIKQSDTPHNLNEGVDIPVPKNLESLSGIDEAGELSGEFEVIDESTRELSDAAKDTTIIVEQKFEQLDDLVKNGKLSPEQQERILTEFLELLKQHAGEASPDLIEEWEMGIEGLKDAIRKQNEQRLIKAAEKLGGAFASTSLKQLDIPNASNTNELGPLLSDSGKDALDTLNTTSKKSLISAMLTYAQEVFVRAGHAGIDLTKYGVEKGTEALGKGAGNLIKYTAIGAVKGIVAISGLPALVAGRLVYCFFGGATGRQ